MARRGSASTGEVASVPDGLLDVEEAVVGLKLIPSTLGQVGAALTVEQHRLVYTPAVAGDSLALHVLWTLMLVCFHCCGGTTWQAEAGADDQRCVDCGAWSWCSRLPGAMETEAR